MFALRVCVFKILVINHAHVNRCVHGKNKAHTSSINKLNVNRSGYFILEGI